MRQLIVHLLTCAIFPVAAQTEPSKFKPKTIYEKGGNDKGGKHFKDSPRFRIYGVDDSTATATLSHLEAAYSCFVKDLGWRSTGLSYNPGSDNGPYYKLNIYGVNVMTDGAKDAVAVMGTNPMSGMSFIQVLKNQTANPAVTVHEFGHALTYHERSWVHQIRTGTWWETVAQFVAETYMTSPLCENARSEQRLIGNPTMFDPVRFFNLTHDILIDGTAKTGNHYDAWPFLHYLTTNLDEYPGLGANTVREMMRKYKKGSNETPLHALERVAAPTNIQQVVASYWARMAYVDIGHPQANRIFQMAQACVPSVTWYPRDLCVDYTNVQSTGVGKYKVIVARQPQYFGANIIPLEGTGKIHVKVTANAPFSSTLAVKSKDNDVSYTSLVGGVGQVVVSVGESISLVIVNTPDSLILYDGFNLNESPTVLEGLDYRLSISGATAYLS